VQKSLPPQTADALNPPANVTFPYTFFKGAGSHVFQPLDTEPNLRNAWRLMDAALLIRAKPQSRARSPQRELHTWSSTFLGR
jgi:hypothetical protein